MGFMSELRNIRPPKHTSVLPSAWRGARTRAPACPIRRRRWWSWWWRRRVASKPNHWHEPWHAPMALSWSAVLSRP